MNEKILKYGEENNVKLGTTVTALLTVYDNYYIFHIGDSRAYKVENGLIQLTNDHTLVNLLVKNGELTEEEAKNHPKKNILMRALGANNPIEVDIFLVEEEVDGVFLCSDGLTTMLNKEQIEKVLSQNNSLEENIIKLIRKANVRGGLDNISIACLKFKEGEE